MKHGFWSLLLLFLSLSVPSFSATKTSATNAKQARELFDKVYNLAFGEQGSKLSYSVNIIGLYKTAGDIIYKGKKLQYQESRYCAWEDGVTAYMVDKKKKKVGIYRADDDNKDEYLSKFKYDLDNFAFSYKTDGDYYVITAKVKDGKFFGIREVVGKVYKKNLYPVSLMIKVAVLRCTVKISNFSSGNIDDNSFVFPKKQFSSYTFEDHRNDSKAKSK